MPHGIRRLIMYIYLNYDKLITSRPSKPKLTASSTKCFAYIWADSFVESISSQTTFPSSPLVMKALIRVQFQQKKFKSHKTFSNK